MRWVHQTCEQYSSLDVVTDSKLTAPQSGPSNVILTFVSFIAIIVE